MDPSLDPQQKTILIIFFLVAAGFVVFFVAMVVTAVVLARKRRQALRRAGLDPMLTGQEQIASSMSVPRRTIEERLAELDDLLRREVISPQEHAAARARILTS